MVTMKSNLGQHPQPQLPIRHEQREGFHAECQEADLKDAVEAMNNLLVGSVSPSRCDVSIRRGQPPPANIADTYTSSS